MNYKKIIAATIGGALAMFVSGYLIWGMLLDGFMTDHATHYEGLIKTTPNFILMFISMIVSALLYTIIFHRWASISTFKTGAIAGATISCLMGLSAGLFNLSYYNLSDETGLVVNIIANLVYGAIAGGVIGAILGAMKDD